MFSIFSTFKPFTDPLADRIQENSLANWKTIAAPENIYLFGNEAGVAERAQKSGFQHIPDVVRSSGLPLLRNLVNDAEKQSPFDLLMYVNGDILFLDDFVPAIQTVQKQLMGRPFLAVGQRWNLILENPIDYADPAWPAKLRGLAQTKGRLSSPASIDYFVFTKGLWPQIPDFTVGQVAFDNWLIYEARRLGRDVVDLTPSTCVIHQHHETFATNEKTPKIVDPEAYAKFMWNRRRSPAALQQIALAGGVKNLFTIADANFQFVEGHIKTHQKEQSLKARLQEAYTALKKGVRKVEYHSRKLLVAVFTRGGLSYNQITRDGFTIRDAPQHGIVQFLFFGGRFDKFKKELVQIEKLLQKRNCPSSIVFDVGASIGRNALYYSRIPGTQVYAFEPIALSYRFLTDNIALNARSNIHPFPLGFSNKQEVLSLAPPEPDQHEWYKKKVGLDRPSLSSVYSTDKKNAQRASMRTVDDFFDEKQLPSLDFLKVDVEGHEWAVLQGSLRTIEKHHPIIQVEINQFTQAISGKSSRDIIAPLVQLGYSLSYFSNGTLIPTDFDHLPTDQTVLDAVLIYLR